MATINNSNFLDLTGWRLTDAKSISEAYGYSPSDSYVPGSDVTLTIALNLNRNVEPTNLLSEDWATRQTMLKILSDSGTLWSTYGTDPTIYQTVQADLQSRGIKILNGIDDGGYISSAESRTIWIQVNNAQFKELFGQELKAQGDDVANPDLIYWNGSLSIDASWGDQLDGLWVNGTYAPDQRAYGEVTATPLKVGYQSEGNGLSDPPALYASDIAKLYHFPLVGSNVSTATIALLEPGIGIALPNSAALSGYDLSTVAGQQALFLHYLNEFRATGGINQSASIYTVASADVQYDDGSGDERSLDAGVVTSAVPNSPIGFYAGPTSNSDVFAAYQAAIWDQTNNPGILSSSWSNLSKSAPDSPFFRAYEELFIDAALRNMSVFISSGDGGSGDEVGNGIPNLDTGTTSPYTIVVGGTSITTANSAAKDQTLDATVKAALASERATLLPLVYGGLMMLPTHATEGVPLIETVWNQYYKQTNGILSAGYLSNETSTGGVDPRVSLPDYQTQYGATITGSGTLVDKGRGVPDVSALAGGNMNYVEPTADMTDIDGYGGGTSASAPLWASLSAQLQAVFDDQGLPKLGYYNDLLYIAAAVAPGSFNDITVGNNRSTFVYGEGSDSLKTYDDGGEVYTIRPTGQGYDATTGYDLTTGLGTPNGLLLARALTTIAHTQLSPDAPAILDTDTRSSSILQHILIQAKSDATQPIVVTVNGSTFGSELAATTSFAWTNALAQKVLQADFDPNLVSLFDGASQIAPHDLILNSGDAVAISINGSEATALQIDMTNTLGLVEYETDLGDVTVARAVAVAQTASSADNQEANVRLRSNAGNTTNSVFFYRVDDLDGSIEGLRPGEVGYSAAAEARGYKTVDGISEIAAPLKNAYAEAKLADVDDGDLIATRFYNGKDTFWSFSSANERGGDGQNVTHIWNYGLNTWGWEDLYGGGDMDFNDVIVQLDFTSATGSQWLA